MLWKLWIWSIGLYTYVRPMLICNLFLGVLLQNDSYIYLAASFPIRNVTLYTTMDCHRSSTPTYVVFMTTKPYIPQVLESCFFSLRWSIKGLIEREASFWVHWPSFTMPTARHFWKRQNWHRFLLLLSTGQFLSARHTYLAFFCTVRCKANSHYSLGDTKWTWLMMGNIKDGSYLAEATVTPGGSDMDYRCIGFLRVWVSPWRMLYVNVESRKVLHCLRIYWN